ncbi:MAG: PEP-CTERM sorting domain-containing protein [Akkermansiaceae bacterium]|nr:PEP-CTERM sorting domain-containing protein [Akkermansiaceae bacterium]
MKTQIISAAGALFLSGAVSAQSYFDFTTPVSHGDTITASDGITTADVSMTGGRLTSFAGDTSHWFIGYNWDNNLWSSTASLTFSTPVSFASILLYDFGEADVEIITDTAMSLGAGTLNGYTATFSNGNQTLYLADNDGNNNTINQYITLAGAITSITVNYSTATTEPPFATGGSDWSRIYFPGGFTTVPEPSSALLFGLGLAGIALRRKR